MIKITCKEKRVNYKNKDFLLINIECKGHAQVTDICNGVSTLIGSWDAYAMNSPSSMVDYYGNMNNGDYVSACYLDEIGEILYNFFRFSLENLAYMYPDDIELNIGINAE